MRRVQSEFTTGEKATRAVWGIVWLTLFRISPRTAFRWRAMLLRVFGATVGKRVRVYNSAKFFWPGNAILRDDCVIGPDVDFYCVAKIDVAAGVIVSQYAHLCAATHDFRSPTFDLLPKPIRLESECWIAAGAFIGPGVTIGERSVIGARAAVFRDVPPGHIMGGNPAANIGKRDEIPVRPKIDEAD